MKFYVILVQHGFEQRKNSKFDFLFLALYFYLSDDSVPKFSDYRPVFFDGRAVWIQDAAIEPPQPAPLQSTRTIERTTVTHPFTQFDERQQSVWTSTRVCE
jgi:hypothetical protein